jgi:hypothetical protein
MPDHRVPKSLLYVAQMIDCGQFKPFRIIEKVQTIDGPRDRITSQSFATLAEAQMYIKELHDHSLGGERQ